MLCIGVYVLLCIEEYMFLLCIEEYMFLLCIEEYMFLFCIEENKFSLCIEENMFYSVLICFALYCGVYVLFILRSIC